MTKMTTDFFLQMEFYNDGTISILEYVITS